MPRRQGPQRWGWGANIYRLANGCRLRWEFCRAFISSSASSKPCAIGIPKITNNFMNQTQIASLIRTGLKVLGTALATHGLTTAATILNSEDVIGLIIMTYGVILSHLEHDNDKTKSGGNIPLAIIGGLFAASFLSGCANTVYKSPANQTLITERFFGIKVTATSGSGTPEVCLGAGSSTFAVNPVSTNTLYAAPSFSTVEFSQSINPFATSGSESAGWGNVSVNLSTNATAQSATILPKLPMKLK